MRTSLKKQLLTASRHLANKRVLVVGDLMLDLYVQGPPRAVSQEAPVIIVQTTSKRYKLGGAANSAENIRALGGTVYLTGVTGDLKNHEDYGRSFSETLRKSKLDRRGVFHDASRPTTLKMRIISNGQQIVRVDEEVLRPITKTLENKILQYIQQTLPRVDAVLISDYQKGVVTQRIMQLLHRVCTRRSIPIIVDPKPQHKSLYKGVDFMTPNEVELFAMLGAQQPEKQRAVRLAQALRQELDVRNVLLTRGPDGMDLIQADGTATHIPTYATQVIDVSGAGDTVAAIIALGAKTVDPILLTHLAAVAAKVSVEKHGTATVTLRELIATIKQL